jgi:hypothetical protein
MEELLNKLIEKGWKPFGRNYERYEHWCLIHEFTTKDWVYSYWQYPTTLREFCAKESWLWQFVCKNKLVKPQVYAWYFYREWMWKEVCKEDYEFRLIESALCDEDKLEEFLLNSIKLD